MIFRITRGSLAFILICALLLPSVPTIACGPDFTLPAYTDFHVPDSRDLSYERGQLGVLQRGYYHIYLYEAYRNLTGKPFNDAELKVLKSWPQTAPAQEQAQSGAIQKPEDWITAWREVREKALGKSGKNGAPYHDETGITRMENEDNRFLFYYNCFQDAFRNAVQIAKQREKQFGAENSVYKEWVAAQDFVFFNCGAKPKPALIPAAARVEDPAIIRADRAYQIAAAHFYAGDFDEAKTAFEQIAKDSSSPYQGIAPYLVARTLIRKATLSEDEDQFDRDTMAEAEKQLLAMIADKNSPEFHPAAKRLLGFVRIRLHPEERLLELENVLLAVQPTQTWSQDLTDYLWLLNHPQLFPSTPAPSPTPATTALPPRASVTPQPPPAAGPVFASHGSDLTDWILTFQQNGEPAFQRSLQRWHETKSLPWLVAAIMKVNPKDTAAVPELTSAASATGADSPAFLTLTFHRLRLLEQSGQNDKARRELDALLTQRAATMPVSARNEFRALRMKLAVSLSEFLQFATRVSTDAANVGPPPAGQTSYKPGSPEYAATQPHFDSDASVVLTEKLPLRTLADAAKSDVLPPDLRSDVAVAAWTRAILLKNESVARELEPVLTGLLPELKTVLTDYDSATDPEHRAFAAALAILRNPGFRPFVSANPARGWFISVPEESGFGKIDDFHDNWWCTFAPPPKDQNWGGWNYYRMFASPRESLQDVYPGGAVGEPGFLPPEGKGEAEQEWAALAAQPSAPRWLGKTMVEWANAHPDDPLVPEALHLVVRAWRYGCTESAGENYSKQAFELLHKRYPDNEWTKKTPYWFN